MRTCTFVQLPNSPLQCAVPLKKSSLAFTTLAALFAIGLLVAAWQIDSWKHEIPRDTAQHGAAKFTPALLSLERSATALPVSKTEGGTASPVVIPATVPLVQGIALSKPAPLTAYSSPSQ